VKKKREQTSPHRTAGRGSLFLMFVTGKEENVRAVISEDHSKDQSNIPQYDQGVVQRSTGKQWKEEPILL